MRKRELFLAAAALLLALALTGCGQEGAEPPAEKDSYYEILDADGTVLYTVADADAVAELDGLLEALDMENGWPDGAPEEALYTYVRYQEKTLLAGEPADDEREYEVILRLTVREDGDTVTTQVMPEVMEGLSGALPQVDFQGLLTFSYDAPAEVAEALRDPARFAEA